MTTTTPRSGGGYWQTVLLALIAICPGLINFTALQLLSPTIAQDLGAGPADAAWVSLLGNAALPVGFVAGAELSRGLIRRRLIVSALGLFAASSLAAALAPTLLALVAARVAQGFAAGLASIVIVLPLVSGYPRSRLPVTFTVLSFGLFGATTLGPLLGGVVEQAGSWRVLFGVDAVLSVAAIVLARFVVPAQPAPDPRSDLDLTGLSLASVGVTLLFIGIGQLSWQVLETPRVEVPLVLGLAALAALIAVEAVHRDPVLTVRCLVRPRSIWAALVSCLAAVAFGGVLDVLLQFLQQVRALGARDASLLLWPAPVAALVGALLVGVIFTKPHRIMVLAVGGLVLLAVAAWLLTSLTAFTGDASIMLVSAMLGLGASISVVPAMVIAALRVPGDLVGRAVALIMMLPYVLIAATGPFLTYLIGVWQTIHYEHLVWVQQSDLLFSGASSSQAQAANTSIVRATLMNHGLVLGMNDAARLVLLIIVLGAAVSVPLLLMGWHVPAEGASPS